VQVDKTKTEHQEFNQSGKCRVCDYLPNVIWAKMFLAEQGYELITRVPFALKRTVEHLAERSPNTSTSNISL